MGRPKRKDTIGALVSRMASPGGGQGEQGGQAGPAVAGMFDEHIKDELAELAGMSLQILWPEKVIGAAPVGKYDAAMHARVCRCKLFGLSDRAAAKRVGVSYKMLASWRERFPGLSADMDMAVEIANEHAAVLLRKLMQGDGPTAFQSIKFFLRTHSPEFQERQRIEVQVDHKETIRLIRENLYGLSAPGEGGMGGELPVLDAEVAGVGGEAEASASNRPALPCGLPAGVELGRLDLSAMVGVDAEAADRARLEPKPAESAPVQTWDDL